jgi:hypothetical protein
VFGDLLVGLGFHGIASRRLRFPAGEKMRLRRCGGKSELTARSPRLGCGPGI